MNSSKRALRRHHRQRMIRRVSDAEQALGVLAFERLLAPIFNSHALRTVPPVYPTHPENCAFRLRDKQLMVSGMTPAGHREGWGYSFH